jgi:hypothetical protein
MAVIVGFTINNYVVVMEIKSTIMKPFSEIRLPFMQHPFGQTAIINSKTHYYCHY